MDKINQPNRKISKPLLLGIAVFPILFAWMLLNKGYSTKSRVLAFGWLFALFFVFLNSSSPDIATPTLPEKWYSYDVKMFDMGLAPAVYKSQIKENLRDPKSFEFISAGYYLVDSVNLKGTKKTLKPYSIIPKIDSTMIVSIRYRARNGFGGVNVEVANFVVTPTLRTMLNE